MGIATLSAADFRFGLETEYIVIDRETNQALWHTELTFERLNNLLEQVPLDGIPSLDGLELEPPHKKLMPFVVEGYHLPGKDFYTETGIVPTETTLPSQAKEMLPKGIEIRTPVCGSIEECLAVQRELLRRLDVVLATDGLGILAMSHHPNAHHFRGPQNKRRHDYWQWSMEVMTTYGPDINVGLPEELWKHLDQDDLLAKINYYGTALTLLSLRAPFRDGKLWNIRGQVGKSLRVYRRSIIAPPIEVHPHENRRLEFKVFDMTPSLDEMEGYFLLFLTLLLGDELKGRASQATRVYDSGHVAVDGFAAEDATERLAEIFAVSETVLPRWGFSTAGLKTLRARFDARRTPADDLIERYHALNDHLPTLIGQLARETVGQVGHA